jgi:hypothetical protein
VLEEELGDTDEPDGVVPGLSVEEDKAGPATASRRG